jgi:histidinol phosphatase-like PHP family hydrolase
MRPLRSEHGPFTGRYLFHLHTDFTDGRLTVQQYFEYASRHEIGRLIFLEHIRREPTYDVEAFVAQVREISVNAGIPAMIGFEAKLLPDGRLDISDTHLAMADVVGIAEHSFPDDLCLLQGALKTAVDRYTERPPDQAIVWVHPGLWFQKRGLMPARDAECASLIQYALNKGVLIERNTRYHLIPERLLPSVPLQSLVHGVDAHRWEDLPKPVER